MAAAHQYQPPSVTAATSKPAARTASIPASPSRHHRGTLNSRSERIWAKHHEIRRGMEGWHRRSSYHPAASSNTVTARRARRWGLAFTAWTLLYPIGPI
jgi:hypothetical protein